jgi:hypothetical protein
MIQNFREFEAGPDPFGVTWKVRFGWLQTAISIRHSDSVDVKFFISDGQQEMEKIIALKHADLLKLIREEGRLLTDPWCMKLAALHVKRMIESGEDLDKTIITPSLSQIRGLAALLREQGVPAGT